MSKITVENLKPHVGAKIHVERARRQRSGAGRLQDHTRQKRQPASRICSGHVFLPCRPDTGHAAGARARVAAAIDRMGGATRFFL